MFTLVLQNQPLAYSGDASLLLCPLTTFLCSHRVPDGLAAAIRNWVERLDAANTCVVCGDLTADERYTLDLLAQRGVPSVLALARSIPESIGQLHLSPAVQTAFEEGRLVIISPVTDVAVTDTSGKTSAARNRLMINIAQQIVVGYMTENGNLASQLLGRQNVMVLKDDVQVHLPQTDAQRIQHQQTQMGWAIFRQLKEGSPEDSAPLTSLQMRQLLNQYLKLDAVERPSLLHSLILFQVVSRYGKLPDFDFTAFLRLWDVQNLRIEDWRSTKVGEKWMPSLAERVMSRLFQVLPSRFHPVINASERFDPALAHALLDAAFAKEEAKSQRPNYKANLRLYRRALSLAYFEHDSEKIEYYKKMIK